MVDPHDGTEIPKAFAQVPPKTRSFDDMNTGQMVFELQGTVGELKEAVASLARAISSSATRLEAIERNGLELKDAFRLLAPKIDDLTGFSKHRTPQLADKADLATLKADLKLEIDKRPTRRQAVLDIAWVVGLITAAVTFGARLAK